VEEKELHLRDYLRVIDRRRYTIGTFFIVVFVIVLVATLSATPVYMATTKVLIDKSAPTNLAAVNFYYEPYDPDFAETQYQLIKSEVVAQRVASLLSLDTTYDNYFSADGRGLGVVKWIRGLFLADGDAHSGSRPAGPAKGEELSRADRIAKTISGSIIVTPVKNSKIVEISYMATNPAFAALVANTVTKAYMDTLLEMRMSSSKYAMQWIQQKADEEKAKLEHSEEALQQYMRVNDIVTLENKVTMVPEKIAEVASKLAEAETRRKAMEALYSQVQSVADNPARADTVSVISADPTIQALRVQILNAEQNITDLSKKYGPKHPAMIAAREDLRALKARKDQEIKRVIASVKNDYELAKATEENFRQMGGQTKAETQSLNEKFVQYGVLKRDADTNQQLYEAMIKQMKEQGITQDAQTVNVYVIQKAETPKSPAKPKKGLNILLGLIVGLAGGIGTAFFIEYLDNTVKSPDDVETKLGVPVYGIVPLLSKENSIEEIIRREPQSPFSESYKTIRTAIQLSRSAKPPKNLLIASIAPGEGKTATAVNLALTIAQSEYSVLLIDGDLRKPRIHKIFGLDASTGLSTYLAGASGADVIFREAAPHLTVVPAGPIPPNPSELLGSAMMQGLLQVVSERFDFVIWDSSPLLTVADGLILSKVVDGTVVIAKHGVTTYDGLRKGLKALSDIEAPFLGIVINAADFRKGDYYYQGYYHYAYSAAEGEERS
jgi:succinoglycan biosynthesis transport protein ExoP